MNSARPSRSDTTTIILSIYALSLPFDIVPLSTGFTATAITAPIAVVGLMLRGSDLAAWMTEARSRSVLICAYVLLVWTISTVIWSRDQSASVVSSFTLAQNLLLFVLIAATARYRDWAAMFWCFGVSATFIAIQVYLVGAIDSTRATFVGLDPNTVALVLATGAATAVVLVSWRPHSILAGILLLVIAMTSVSVVLTGSRTGLVATVLVVLALVVIGSGGRGRQLFFVSVLLGGSFGIGSFLVSTGRLPERILDFRGAGLAGDSSRSDILTAYFSGNQEWMLFGIGSGADSAFLLSYRGWSANAHGLIWKSWVETGLVGLLILLTLLYLTYARAGHNHVRQVAILSLPLGAFALSLGGMGLNLFWWICAFSLWSQFDHDAPSEKAASPVNASADRP